MKIVILGNTNSPIPNRKVPYSWFVKTFKEGCERNGHQVIGIHYRSHDPGKIREKIKHIKPQIMFTHLSFHPIYPVDRVLTIYRDIRKSVGTKIVHVLADARHEPRYNGNLHGAVDVALVSQTENLQKFKDYWRIPTFFCPYASLYQDKLAKPVASLSYKDPVFTGTPNAHPDRSKYIEGLKRVMPIKIFQTQSAQDLREKTPELSISADCILGLCTGYDIKHYIDVRPFQYLGAGACMIIRKFKNMDDIIPDNIYYPINSYNSPREIKDIFQNKIQKTNTRPIREKAFKFIQKYHSSQRRMKDVIDVIMGKRNNIRSFLDEI